MMRIHPGGAHLEPTATMKSEGSQSPAVPFWLRITFIRSKDYLPNLCRPVGAIATSVNDASVVVDRIRGILY